MTKADRKILMAMFRLLMQGLLWLLRPDHLNPGHGEVLREDYDAFLDDSQTVEWEGR